MPREALSIKLMWEVSLLTPTRPTGYQTWWKAWPQEGTDQVATDTHVLELWA